MYYCNFLLNLHVYVTLSGQHVTEEDEEEEEDDVDVDDESDTNDDDELDTDMIDDRDSPDDVSVHNVEYVNCDDVNTSI